MKRHLQRSTKLHHHHHHHDDRRWKIWMKLKKSKKYCSSSTPCHRWIPQCTTQSSTMEIQTTCLTCALQGVNLPSSISKRSISVTTTLNYRVGWGIRTISTITVKELIKISNMKIRGKSKLWISGRMQGL